MDKEEIYCRECLNMYNNIYNECPFCEDINNNTMKKALILFDNGNGNMYYLGLIEVGEFKPINTTSGVISMLDVNTCMSEDSRDYIIIGYNDETYKIGDNRVLKELSR